MSKQHQPSTPTLPIVAAIATVVLVLAAIALVAMDLIENSQGRKIEEASQTPLLHPLVCGALLLVAAGWLVWLAKTHGTKHLLTIITATAAALLLVATPLLAWQATTAERELTVISMTCDAETLRSTGDMAQASCVENPVDTIVLLGGVKSDDSWTPETITDNQTRDFTELPAGDWESTLEVDGPPDTVAVVATGEKNGETTRLGSFRPYMDAESGRLRWRALVRMDADISKVHVQFYLSANPAVESASVRFQVRECRGQLVRDFDAEQCTPTAVNSPLVMEVPPTDVRTWRHPHVANDGSGFVITNLEARDYLLQPDYASIELYAENTDVHVIPAAMPQVAENSVAVPGESRFTLPIESNTGELVYTIYIFPRGDVYAQDSQPSQ